MSKYEMSKSEKLIVKKKTSAYLQKACASCQERYREAEERVTFGVKLKKRRTNLRLDGKEKKTSRN